MPTNDEIIDLAADLAYAGKQLWDALLARYARPRSIVILVNGKEPTGMAQPVNDTQFFVHAMGRDAGGVLVPLALTDSTTWSVVELDGTTPSSSATVAADPNHAGDSSYQQVDVVNTGGVLAPPFKLKADDTTISLSGVSDELDPTAGGPTALDVELSTT